MNSDDTAVCVDDRAAGVAGIGVGVIFEHMVHGRPGRFAIGLAFGDDAARQGVFRIAEGETGDVDFRPDIDRPVIPGEVGIVFAVNVDHGQVRTFRDAEDAGIARLSFAADPDLQEGRAGDDVVVGDGNAGGVDDEAGTATGGVQLQAFGRIDEAALSFDLHDGLLHILEGGDGGGGSRGNGRGRVRDGCWHVGWRFCWRRLRGDFLGEHSNRGFAVGVAAATGRKAHQRDSNYNQYSAKAGEFLHGLQGPFSLILLIGRRRRNEGRAFQAAALLALVALVSLLPQTCDVGACGTKLFCSTQYNGFGRPLSRGEMAKRSLTSFEITDWLSLGATLTLENFVREGGQGGRAAGVPEEHALAAGEGAPANQINQPAHRPPRVDRIEQDAFFLRH